jgi:D-alanyl-D-alanine carboxypeptidase/D-alanyl-D-alanine-endopeptidase (penicillin-binding protein 4)
MTRFCFIFSFFLTITLSAQNRTVEKFLDTKGFENASVGICIKDNDGKILFHHNKSASLTPASVMKVVTSATALELLGADYQIKTVLLFDSLENILVVKGCGDPTLGSEYIKAAPDAFLQNWAHQIKQKVGSREIGVIIDDSYFGYSGLSNKWIREDIGNYYAAGTYGISIYDNAYKLIFDTTAGNAEITGTEPEVHIDFVNTLKLNETGSDNGYIIGEPFSDKRLIIGDIPAGRKAFSIKGDIPDPGQYLGNRLVKYLKDSNVMVTSVTTSRLKFSEIKPLAFYTHLSPPIKDILRFINIRSNNHYSEHIIRL